MDAGRRAYLRVWPDDDDVAAAADVSHLGRALYQLAHADGWHSLDQVEGLRPTGGAVAVLQQDELLGPDPDKWPDELFDDDAELLFSQHDVFGPWTDVAGGAARVARMVPPNGDRVAVSVELVGEPAARIRRTPA